jgi:hypothetical protein
LQALLGQFSLAFGFLTGDAKQSLREADTLNRGFHYFLLSQGR